MQSVNLSSNLTKQVRLKTVTFRRQLQQTIYLRNEYKEYQGRAMLMTISKSIEKKKLQAFTRLTANLSLFEQKKTIIRIVDYFIRHKDRTAKIRAFAQIRNKAGEFQHKINIVKKLQFLEKTKTREFKKLVFCKFYETFFRLQFQNKLPKQKTRREMFYQADKTSDIIQGDETRQGMASLTSPLRLLAESRSVTKFNSPVTARTNNMSGCSFSIKEKDQGSVKTFELSEVTKQVLRKLQKYDKKSFSQQIQENLKEILNDEIKRLERLKIANRFLKESPSEEQLLLKVLSNAFKLIEDLMRQTQSAEKEPSESAIGDSRFISVKSIGVSQSRRNLPLRPSSKESKEKQFQRLRGNINKQLDNNSLLYAKNQIAGLIKRFAEEQKFKPEMQLYEYFHKVLGQNQRVTKCFEDSRKLIEKLSGIDIDLTLQDNASILHICSRDCSNLINKALNSVQTDQLTDKMLSMARCFDKITDNLTKLFRKVNQKQTSNNSNFVTSTLHKKVLEEKEKVIEELKQKIKEQNYKIHLMGVLQQQCSKVQNQLQIETQAEAVLRQQLQKYKSKLKKYQDHKREFQDSNKQSQRHRFQLETLKTELASTREEQQNLKHKIQILECKIRQQVDNIRRINNLFEISQGQLDQHQKKQLAFKQDIMHLKVQLNNQRNKIDTLQIENQILQSNNKRNKQDLEKEKKKSSQFSERNSQLLLTNKNLLETLQEQENKYRDMEQRFKETLDMDDDKLIRQSQMFLEALEFQNSNFKEECNKETIDESKRNLDELLFQNRVLQQELSNQKKLTESLKLYQSDLEHLLQAASKQQINPQHSQENIQDQPRNQNTRQFIQLKESYQKAIQQIKILEVKVQQYQQSIRVLEIDIGRLFLQISQPNEEMLSLRSENLKLNQQLADLNHAILQTETRHALEIEEWVKKALKAQEQEVNEFLAQHDLHKQQQLENIIIPNKRKQWQKGLQSWIDSIIMEEKRYWEAQVLQKYRLGIYDQSDNPISSQTINL